MKIWYSPYQLYPQFLGPNKSKNKFRKGALLRIRFEEGLVGYADLCPFSEMGDRPLEMELKQLVVNKPTEMGERSLYFAKMDAEARAHQTALYDRTAKIKNHFLITDLNTFDVVRIAQLESSGFSEIKIKMGRDLQNETVLLERLSQKLSAGTKLRIDFNATLNRDRFVDWFEKNQKWLRPVLDFIEDPFTYNAQDWREVSKKWNIPFALDLAGDALSTGAEGAPIVVLKPAVQDVDKIIASLKDKNKKFVFTHYMDFPVGQMFALVSAQNHFHELGSQLLTCGLQHHDLYEGLTFQSAIKSDGPYILPPDGYGIGFDKWLTNQTWTELT